MQSSQPQITQETLRGRVGDVIVIPLTENPSTGYEWELQLPAGIQDIGEDYVASSEQLIGASGKKIYRVQIIQPGNSIIQAVYKRPWETQIANIYQLQVLAI